MTAAPRVERKRTNDNPEHRLQVDVHNYLKVALPQTVLWSASASGVRVSMHVATIMKAMGVKRGVPDLVFLPPDGLARWIELKKPSGRQSDLSMEQRQWRDQCKAAGTWAFAQSVADVARALRGWGVELAKHPFYPEHDA